MLKVDVCTVTGQYVYKSTDGLRCRLVNSYTNQLAAIFDQEFGVIKFM